jgi:hypothetical protein
MAYEQKPNTGTLLENDRKQSETHPDYKGDLLISRELLEKIAKYGEAKIEISAWIGETKKGKPKISITCKEPYQKPESSRDISQSDRHNPDYTSNYASEPEPRGPHRSGALVETDRGVAFTEYRQPPAPAPSAPAPKAPPDPAKYLAALKAKIAKIENYPDFEELYNKIHAPEVWEVFKSVPAIAQEASSLLSAKKTELILGTEPVDLSAIISAIDVECDRLNIHKKAHCLQRWNRTRAQLTPDELQIYLDELRIAQPIPPSDDFF